MSQSAKSVYDHWNMVGSGIRKSRELGCLHIRCRRSGPLTFFERIDLALWGCGGKAKYDNALSKRAALGRTPTRKDINRAINRMFYGRERNRDFLEALGID